MNNLPILAQADGGAGGGFGMWGMIAIYALIIVAVYFFLLRPNSKKKKEEAEMRNSLEIGDDITTIGGIMGRIVAIKDDEDAIIIETGSDRVKMKFKKWCISSVDTVKDKGANAAPEKKSFFSRFKKNDDENKTAE
ncbi:MAG TPA: preprotein translocase subunit YajC [Ruminococcaceae bacterium]|nr:preprotein translocase subunit YajC [Oscillospiraceae bacterium]